MFARAYQVALLTTGLLIFAGLASAQTGRLGGRVIGEDGQPVKDAVVRAERQEVPGGAKVKTNKRGEYTFGFLQMGLYSVVLEVDGAEKARVNGVKPASAGDPAVLDFDLGKEAANQEASESGELSEAQLKNMSSDQRKRYEERLNKRREQISKNQDLNDAYNTGMEAMAAKNYEVAIASFKTAGEVDPSQVAIWGQLAVASSQLAATQSGDAAKTSRDEAVAAYGKAIELKPDDPNFHNNLGLELIKQGKMEEGKQELANAALLAPTDAGKFHYNLGATLMNQGDSDGAINAFQDAATSTPPYPEAYYQIGLTLMGKASVDDKGNTVPAEGTIEAFQNYLKAAPSGPNAPTAQNLLASLQGSVDMSFENPDAKTRKKRK